MIVWPSGFARTVSAAPTPPPSAGAIDDHDAGGVALLHSLGHRARDDVHHAARRVARDEVERPVGILRKRGQGAGKRNDGEGDAANHEGSSSVSGTFQAS